MELHINTYGAFIKKKDAMFELTLEGRIVKIAPDKVSSIVISNAVSISSDAIQLALEHNIDIVFLDQYGDPYGRVCFPKLGSTTLIRRRQLEMLSDEIGLEFTKQRIIIKIMNQFRLLQKLLSKRDRFRDKYENDLHRMWEFAISVRTKAGSLDEASGSFMGWEGGTSKIYFSVLSDLIPEDFRFEGRSSRPAHDHFNCLLNYGYGILYSKVERALIIAGLDPYIGLLHCDNYNKKSFVFDFIEPYRILIDEPVFYLFSRRKIDPDGFDQIHRGVVLNTIGKKFFAPYLLEYFAEVIRYHNKNRKRIDQIQTDAHAFANYLIGKRSNYLESSIARKLDNFLDHYPDYESLDQEGDDTC
ncbi:MAG: CRISPR-associated endonuclease Cas1 [Candidatus Cloacimonetes bacterium]|nr:CRISPR-associated endonuclease Cas1 [Candidatus Cloacimonadota bacterium]